MAEIGQFLNLETANWLTCGNKEVDWLSWGNFGVEWLTCRNGDRYC